MRWVAPIVAIVDFVIGLAMIEGGSPSVGVGAVIVSFVIVVGWMRFWGWLRL